MAYLVGPVTGKEFGVLEAAVRDASNGSKFVQLTLTDGEEPISAKIWSWSGGTLPMGVIAVIGTIELYQGKAQLIIKRWQPLDVSAEKYAQKSPIAFEVLHRRMEDLLDQIREQSLRELVESLTLLNPAFLQLPAATTNHHNYRHGLLEHSVEVGELAVMLADKYPQVNKDLLISGAILHDFGKTFVYAYRGLEIVYTDIGHFHEHLAYGAIMLQQHMQPYGLSESIQQQLLHCLLAHHGNLEWGSPVRPVTREAFLVHHADMISSSLCYWDQAAQQYPDQRWSAKMYPLARQLFVGGA